VRTVEGHRSRLLLRQIRLRGGTVIDKVRAQEGFSFFHEEWEMTEKK
jgi:hypothetical protein